VRRSLAEPAIHLSFGRVKASPWHQAQRTLPDIGFRLHHLFGEIVSPLDQLTEGPEVVALVAAHGENEVRDTCSAQ
jgi:hypothetical protein